MIKLIELPYAADALEPVISAKTLAFHHGKHLQGYVDKLNELIPDSLFEGVSIEKIVARAPAGPVFNNAGQILNHNLYFTQFRPVAKDGGAGLDPTPDAPHSGLDQPHPGLDPGSPLAKQIARQWGTLAAFRAEFEANGVGIFGSGWVWLAADPDGKLVITQESGAGNPITRGLKPLLTFDVWEHAYYLDYQNRRAAHLAALWQIVDWDVIARRYEK